MFSYFVQQLAQLLNIIVMSVSEALLIGLMTGRFYYSNTMWHIKICSAVKCSMHNAPINVLPHLPPYWQKLGILDLITIFTQGRGI